MVDYVETEPCNFGALSWTPKRYKEYMGGKMICSESIKLTVRLESNRQLEHCYIGENGQEYGAMKVHFENNDIPSKICDTVFDMQVWLRRIDGRNETQRLWMFCNPEHTNSDVWFIGKIRRRYPYTQDTKIYAPNEPVVASIGLVEEETEHIHPMFRGYENRVSFIMSNPHRRIVFEE